MESAIPYDGFMTAMPFPSHLAPSQYSAVEAPGYSPPDAYLPLPAYRKRVAFVANSASALIGSFHGLILDMVNRGHRTLAFAPGLGNKEFRYLAHIGAEAYSLSPDLDLWERYRRLREMADIFENTEPDMVIVQSARGGAMTVAAAKMAKVPHVITVVPSLGPAFCEGAGRVAWGERQAMKAVYRTLFRASDLVIFHSSDDRHYAESFKLLSPSKPQLIVNGWGEDLMRNVQRPLPPLDKGLFFLMAAPLDRMQGILEFCEAARELRQKTRRARFFFASTAGEVISPVALDEIKKHRQHVQYVGAVADASSLIARCHAVVAPSYGIGAPRSVFTALALGRPVIATDTRSCRDLVQPGQNGYLVPVRDSALLARAMIRLLQRPDLMPMMASESRRLALRYCEINTVNAIVLEALGL